MAKGSGQAQVPNIRTKMPGREMLVWVLEKKWEGRNYFQAANMQNLSKQGTKEFKEKSKAFMNYGVTYDPSSYREDGHPNASTASQIQTRKALVTNGLLTNYPKTGHCRYLDLTAEGERLAEFFWANGMGSPGEIERAMKRSSRMERVYASIFRNRMGRPELPLEDMRKAQHHYVHYMGEVARKEEECRTYLNSLPVGVKREEAKRISDTPFDGNSFLFVPYFEFTDGGEVDIDDLRESLLVQRLVN